MGKRGGARLTGKAGDIVLLREQLREAGLPRLEQEIRFHPQRQWRIDYGFSKLKIGIEYEGGVFGIGKKCPTCEQRPAGRHTRGVGYEKDCVKYAEANLFGWILIRVTSNLIKDGTAANLIKRAHAARSQAEVSTN